MALALFENGEQAAALGVALKTLIPTLAGYRRALGEYVDALFEPDIAELLDGFHPTLAQHILGGLGTLLSTPSRLTTHARGALIRRVAKQHGSSVLAQHYAEYQEADLPVSVLAYLDAASCNPASVTTGDLQELFRDGYQDEDIVILNNIAAVTAVTARLIEGARVIRSNRTDVADSLRPATIDSAPVEIRQASWSPWLDLITDEEVPAELHEKFGARLKLPFLRVLARTPGLLDARVGLEQIALTDRGGLGRGEREIAATVMSRISGCDTCAMVHARKAAHFLDDEPLPAQLLTGDRFGEHAPRIGELIQFAAELSVTPVAVRQSTVARMREHGFSEAELLQLVAAVAYMAWPNRVTLALGEITEG